MLLWHIGGTIAIVRYAFHDDRMDLRLLIVGAVLPDLVDKPLALFGFDIWHSVRLVGHSLLFGACLMTGVLLLTRRGRPRKRWMPLAVGVLIHLFLDFMWTDAETLWWPFLGTAFTETGATGVVDYTIGLLRSPWMWVGEAVGLVYLLTLSIRGGLRSLEGRRTFVTTGRIDVPIEP